MTIGPWLRTCAERHGDREAIEVMGAAKSYAGRMAHFAVPRYIRWMDELPRNASERVQKFQLRAEGLTPGTWDRRAETGARR